MLEKVIADQVAVLQRQDLDSNTLHLLKRNLVDSFAGICASLSDVGMIAKFKTYAAACADPNGVEVWGTGMKAQLVHAVFLNTILGRRSDLVNTYFSTTNLGGNHPSDNVSLLLTLLGWREMGGLQLLKAMYLAYMLSCAYSDYYDPQASGYDHDAAAVFYTALVIGQVLGLDRQGLIQVQRIAGARGLASNQSALGQLTDWRHCTYASCAMQGIESALMARAGFEGPEDIYQGQAGANHFMSHAKSFMAQSPDLSSIVFKQWPALVFCQTPIDVALKLWPRFRELDAGRVAKVEVWSYHQALAVGGQPQAYFPASRAGRTHSLPFCVAGALLRGTVNEDLFSEPATHDQALQELMAKVVLHEDSKMTAEYPSKAPCRIVISCQDGRVLSAQQDYPRGDPHDPMSDEEINAKAQEYLSRLISAKQSREVIKRIWEIENANQLNFLLMPLCA